MTGATLTNLIIGVAVLAWVVSSQLPLSEASL